MLATAAGDADSTRQSSRELPPHDLALSILSARSRFSPPLLPIRAQTELGLVEHAAGAAPANPRRPALIPHAPSPTASPRTTPPLHELD